MTASLRRRWDTVKDEPIVGRQFTLQEEHERFRQAASRPVPEYRAKVVRLEHGQIEVSITPADSTSVRNARMGFNPLLDCSRQVRSAEDQEERDSENRARAAKKSRQSVRFLVKTIHANHMLTFGWRDAITSRIEAQKMWQECVRLYRLRFEDWQYIAVLEKHDSEETSEAKVGSYHIHAAVSGKVDIRWLLRCWLVAIGQPLNDVNDWYSHGVKLGEKSMGSVNVEPPKKRRGSASKKWRRDTMSSYLTKYIGKEFVEAEKGKKKYWHSKGIKKPLIERYWLRANTFAEAVAEAHDIVMYSGVCNISMWGDFHSGVIWITGDTEREMIGRCTEGVLESFND